jgi:hypothetical protein
VSSLTVNPGPLSEETTCTQYSRRMPVGSRQQKQQKLESKMEERKDYYPDLLSPDAVPSPQLWTLDFVVRSLRRRLWKAFVDDDDVAALRAYQATFQEFHQWLQEEDELRHDEEERQRKLSDGDGKQRKKVSTSFL